MNLHWMMSTTLISTLALMGCQPKVAPKPAPLSLLPEAPWQTDVLPASAVDPLAVTQWQKAKNRQSCRLLAWSKAWVETTATKPRAANFDGGWGVAYDAPQKRSAFGVAGTGASTQNHYVWPSQITWQDGSYMTYGPEGGTGPKYLAYITIPNQSCLYNVWAVSEAHLKLIVSNLRFVKGMP